MKNKKKSYIRKLVKNFVIKVLIITIGIPAVLFLILTIGSRMSFTTLYRTLPSVYDFLKGIYLNLIYDGTFLMLMCFILWAFSFIIILISFAIKVIKYYDTIMNSYDKILDNKEEYITLPEEMGDVENKINVIKHNIEKSAKDAKESEQRKDDLVVYLAHDIKTPLTSMIGYLSLLDDEKDLSKKQREKYINIALDKSYKMEELINELFDITRFNSEKLILEKEDLDLRLLLEQIIDDFYPVLLDSGKSIILNMKESIIIDADSNKIARVFNNVIKNAINYSKDKSEIKVDVFKEGNKAIINISNIGKEIPKEKLARIFDKFYRVDSSRSTKTGGSGLGLAIAKEIVELHGGVINAMQEGKKTIFHIEIPLS